MHTSLFSGDAAPLTSFPNSTRLAKVDDWIDFGYRVCAAAMASEQWYIDEWGGWTLERTHEIQVDITSYLTPGSERHETQLEHIRPRR